MNTIARILALLFVLVISTPTARANVHPPVDPLDAHFLFPLWVAWFIGGVVLKIMKHRLRFIGVGAVILLIVLGLLGTVLGMDFDEYLEDRLRLMTPALWIWMIYLVLLLAWFIWEREGRNDPTRRLNLIYHGSFLAFVLIGGVALRYFYLAAFFSREQHREAWLTYFGVSLLIFASYALICLVWLALRKNARWMWREICHPGSPPPQAKQLPEDMTHP